MYTYRAPGCWENLPNSLLPPPLEYAAMQTFTTFFIFLVCELVKSVFSH